MPISTHPPNLPPGLLRTKISLEDIHMCTAVPLELLRGFAAGRFKPSGPDLEALQYLGRLIGNYSPALVTLYIDKIRWRILHGVVPAADLRKILDLPGYGEYSERLALLCNSGNPAVEARILAIAKERGYTPPDVPASHE